MINHPAIKGYPHRKPIFYHRKKQKVAPKKPEDPHDYQSQPSYGGFCGPCVANLSHHGKKCLQSTFFRVRFVFALQTGKDRNHENLPRTSPVGWLSTNLRFRERSKLGAGPKGDSAAPNAAAGDSRSPQTAVSRCPGEQQGWLVTSKTCPILMVKHGQT